MDWLAAQLRNFRQLRIKRQLEIQPKRSTLSFLFVAPCAASVLLCEIGFLLHRETPRFTEFHRDKEFSSKILATLQFHCLRSTNFVHYSKLMISHHTFHRLPILLFLWFMGSVLHGQTQKLSDDYIAKAGKTFISEDEFLSRFELLPGFGRHRANQLEGAKAELLDPMIAEKLLAEEAATRGLDKDSTFVHAFQEVRKMLSRDELYREEVSQKVHVTSDQVSEGIAMAMRQLLVSFIYFRKEEDARFIRSQMKKSTDFELLHIDSSFSVIRDTATVIWGDADPAIEKTAYSMKGDEISDVIFAAGGYYILKMKGVQRNNTYASMQPSVLNDRVEERIRLREEKERMEKFVKEVLSDKVGYSVSRTLHELADAINSMCGLGNDTLITFTPEVVGQVASRCKPYLGDTLAVVENSAWSLENVLNRFSSKGFTLRCAKITGIFHQLNTEMELLVRQELLSQEALRRGLDHDPAISKRLEMWRQYDLSLLMKDMVKRSASVNDVEIYSYLESKGKLPRVPRVQIRELRTASLDEMKLAIDQLEKGASLDNVIRQWSVDSAARKNGGISDFFPITEHQPIGELAWEMEVGQRFGPFSTPEGAFYFELLAKKTETTPTDTSMADQMREARMELLRMKQRRLLDLYLITSGRAARLFHL